MTVHIACGSSARATFAPQTPGKKGKGEARTRTLSEQDRAALSQMRHIGVASATLRIMHADKKAEEQRCNQ